MAMWIFAWSTWIRPASISKYCTTPCLSYPATDRAAVEVALCKSWNRWLADIWKQGRGRLRWSCMAPTLSMPDALDQIRWAKENGACAVLLRPIEGQRLLADAYFYPIYEEAQKLDGIAVKSTMHLVFVAPEQAFDRALALKGTDDVASEAEKPKRGLRGMIGRAIEAKTQPEQKSTDQQQTQATFATVTTEIRDVKSTSVPASMFEIPAGYREVQPPTPSR